MQRPHIRWLILGWRTSLGTRRPCLTLLALDLFALLSWNFFQAKSSIYLSVNRSIDLFSSFRHTCGTRNVCLEVASVKCRHNAQPLCLPLIGPNLNFKNTPAEKIFLQRTVCRRKRTSPRRSCSDVVFRSLELPSQNIPASPSRRERIS